MLNLQVKQMAEDNKKEATTPIINKIVKKHAHGHHGGSWKIAYADFVTAMMAFFLLMWLLASLNTAQKEGVAEYFKQPLKVALGGSKVGEQEIQTAGGGRNSHRQDGQVSADTKPLKEKESTSKSQTKEQEDELKQLRELKSEIIVSMSNDPSLAELKDRLIMDVVSDGLLIQLIDKQNKPMFGMGSDKLDPEMELVLNKIATLLNKVPNKIIVQGHTDAHPYYNPEELEQTNWELSAQRANTARRYLVKRGMDENRVVRVSGYASTILLDKKNPFNPNNRRISILVMKKHAEEQITKNQVNIKENSKENSTIKPAANSTKKPTNSTKKTVNPTKKTAAPSKNH